MTEEKQVAKRSPVLEKLSTRLQSPVINRGLEVVKQTEGLVVTDEASKQLAKDGLREVVDAIKEVQVQSNPILTAIREIGRQARLDVEKCGAPLDVAKRYLSGQVGAYRRRLEREAEESARRQEAKAREQEAKGTAPPVDVVKPEVPKDDDQGGVRVVQRKNPYCRLVDKSKVPHEYMDVNTRAAIAAFRASKGTLEIPGLEMGWEPTEAVYSKP